MSRHEAEVDARIADASQAYAKAFENAAWFAKYEGRTFQGTERLAEAVAKRDAALVALNAVEAEYKGWSRFFLVQNNNGHIHRSTRCSTCFITTQYAWLPDLSGLTEADAVDEFGGILCSVCFPSAPSEWTEGVNKKEAARKAAEAALKAVARTPEGKAVIAKRDLVARHTYTLSSIERAADADARRPGIVKKLDKAVAQLAEAEAALDKALGL